MSTDQPDIAARVLAELARDPAFASFATPDAALLVWDAGAARLLGASPGAERLRRTFADAAGRVDPALPARGRLQALGAGLAPLAGLRLERLRLDGLSPPVTCACRRVLIDREPVLVTAILGPMPKGSPRPPPPAAAEGPQPAPEPQSGSPAWTPPSLDALRRRGPTRIVWQADPEGRFTRISPELAAIVGPGAGAVVGRSWAELAGSALEDPDGAVAGLLARGGTWSGLTVHWSVDGTPWRIPVDWAGLPVLGPDRSLAGFRGFGILRADAAAERETAPRPAEASGAGEEAPGAVETAPRSAEGHGSGETAQRSAEGRGSGETAPGEAAGDPTHAPAAGLDGHRAVPLGGGDPTAAGAGPEAHSDEVRRRSASPDGAAARASRERSLRSAETLSRLSVSERSAFREIARALGARFSFAADTLDPAGAESGAPQEPAAEPSDLPPAAPPEAAEPFAPAPVSEEPPRQPERLEPPGPAAGEPVAPVEGIAPEARPEGWGDRAVEPSAPDAARPIVHPPEDPAPGGASEAPPPQPVYPPAPVHILAVPARPAGDRLLDGMPMAALVHRDERVLFANRAFLDLVGCETLAAFEAGGGLTSLFGGSPPLRGAEAGAEPMALATPGGPLRAEVSVAPVDWSAAGATLILLRPERDAGTRERLAAAERDLEDTRGRLGEAAGSRDEALARVQALEAERDEAQARMRAFEAARDEARSRIRELEAVLDTATDGVVVLDRSGRILSLNRAGEALFGYDGREVVGEAITVLLAPESHMVALQYLERLRSSGPARLINDGREVTGRVRQGGPIPLFMTMGPVSDGPDARICAVLRDITAFQKAEGELVAAKRAAEEANAQKSDLLAKISHEIRTPLNAIIGFAEVMLEERFGPVGNERYKDYLKDVHLSGTHVISLVNDLLDLAKIEAGRMELAVTGLSLNTLISASVALLQPQAARERIVLRTSFAPNLPPVMADERSVRQIALNLLSNAIKFTDPGGQVIVSTAATERGEVAFRVRDTGIGMSEAEVAAALEPFRQLATARRRGGTGLGLPLTKALVEANRGALVIRSAPNEGTLVEVLLPTAKVAAG